MNRIGKIHINNFKFFGQEKPIDLDGKHLLLYGENGSGKSSIYWSLYTLFEAPFKDDDADLIKYFEMGPGKDWSLVNIHANEVTPGSGNYDSFIQVTADDDPTPYRLAADDVIIRVSERAKLVNFASDFIQYKLLQSMHNFWHSEPIDLYDFFFEHTLQHIKITGIQFKRGPLVFDSENAYDIWMQILAGPHKGEDALADYEQLAKDFNAGMEKLIDFVNQNAGDFLIRLGYTNFKFYLKYTGVNPTVTNGKYDELAFAVELIISEYEGKRNVVHRAQSFLNEAKLNAIGISVRLAVLFQKINHAGLKFLVLDDLLISLDMNNREKVLDLLLSDDFSKNFQLLILTHDQYFFQMAKHKIKRAGQDDWVYYEMYNINKAGISSPLIRPFLSYIEQAELHFGNSAFDAAGNFLRKATEEFCKEFVPLHLQVDKNYDRLNTNNLIEACVKYAKSNNLQHSLFQDLQDHREFIFNALSHDSYDVPRFRNEIQKCFKTFAELNAVKFKTVFEKDSNTELYFEMHDGKNLYRAEFTIYDELRLIKEPGKDSIIIRGLMLQKVFKDGAKQYWPFKNCSLKPNVKSKVDRLVSGDCAYDSLKRFYDNWFSSSDKKSSPDFWDGILIKETNVPLSSIRAF